MAIARGEGAVGNVSGAAAGDDALRLDLGCGRHKQPGFIGVDKVAGPAVDLVADIEQPLPFDDESAIEVHTHSVIEHLDDPIAFFDEVHRVLRRDGGMTV